MENDFLIRKQIEFVNYRLGQFIHFNSATFQFNSTEMKDWEYDVENFQTARKYPFDPKDFCPDELDCAQWAEASHLLGAKFAALTTKHHEGFCLWPTSTTSHCVSSSPVSTDIVGEYLEAYRSRGIKAGLYFSMLDLTHHIGKCSCTKEQIDFTKKQLSELLTNYGPIPFLIIDGWQADWGGPSYKDMPFEEINSFVKSIQPSCLLLNHSCETSLAHTEIVFYENAAGQEVDDTFSGPGCSGNILTSCWFWRSSDPTSELKSVQWAIDKINQMNKHNVSFLLNASPNIHGKIDNNMMMRFEEIGNCFKEPNPLTFIPKGWIIR